MIQPFDAILAIAFGGPQGLSDVRPFLQNVLRGRRVAPGRVEEVAHHYELFGGVSPITALTTAQASGLERLLASRGTPLPVHVGMRNWHPLLADTLTTMADAGVRRAIGLIMAPHGGYSGCEQYRRNVEQARVDLAGRGRPDVSIVHTPGWHAHPLFVEATARRVEEAAERLPAELRRAARLVFSAHSVPVAAAERSRYREQLAESARLVAGRVGRAEWDLVYQSRSGRPEDPWLEPDISDHLHALHAAGTRAVIVSPIGFIADHVEVLYDLDREAAEVARGLGISMARAAAVNDSPIFIEMLADVVTGVMTRYARGRPLEVALRAATP